MASKHKENLNIKQSAVNNLQLGKWPCGLHCYLQSTQPKPVYKELFANSKQCYSEIIREKKNLIAKTNYSTASRCSNLAASRWFQTPSS